jgi:hypothetical protein
MTSGWIKLHRRLLDSPVWNNSNHNVRQLAVACLLLASHREARLSVGGEVVEIKPGQFWTSQESLEKVTGLTRQQIRTSLAILYRLDFLTSKPTNHGSLVSLINWALYQGSDAEDNQQPNPQITSNQPAANHNQELKELKEGKNLLGSPEKIYLDPDSGGLEPLPWTELEQELEQ